MTETALRVPLGLGNSLRQEVFKEGRHEYVVLGLVGSATLADKETLFLRRIFTLREDEYVGAPGHGGAWRGAAMIPAIEAAVDGGFGLIIVHAHAHGGPPHLSGDDR